MWFRHGLCCVEFGPQIRYQNHSVCSVQSIWASISNNADICWHISIFYYLPHIVIIIRNHWVHYSELHSKGINSRLWQLECECYVNSDISLWYFPLRFSSFLDNFHWILLHWIIVIITTLIIVIINYSMVFVSCNKQPHSSTIYPLSSAIYVCYSK